MSCNSCSFSALVRLVFPLASNMAIWMKRSRWLFISAHSMVTLKVFAFSWKSTRTLRRVAVSDLPLPPTGRKSIFVSPRRISVLPVHDRPRSRTSPAGLTCRGPQPWHNFTWANWSGKLAALVGRVARRQHRRRAWSALCRGWCLTHRTTQSNPSQAEPPADCVRSQTIVPKLGLAGAPSKLMLRPVPVQYTSNFTLRVTATSCKNFCHSPAAGSAGRAVREFANSRMSFMTVLNEKAFFRTTAATASANDAGCIQSGIRM
mmetsp:Transcript_147067/g.256767  ORF Transcript_147067/g.256767 Transcript_147067/m.256767 type:complete len:261 (+) Transcript_147067:2918-3700(+)